MRSLFPSLKGVVDMISSARQAIACILLIWPTIICAQSQIAPDKSSHGTVSGKVTHKDNGVSGVTVGLNFVEEYRQRSSRNKAVTDESGNYRITNVPPGSYEVAVSMLGYVAVSGSRGLRKPVIIGKGETVENVDFAVVRGGVITGKITDADGRPVVEMEVEIDPVRMGDGYIRPGVRTDDRGVYRAFGLLPGQYKVSAGNDERTGSLEPWRRVEYKLTYHPAVTDPQQATVIEVGEGAEVSDIDITLGRSAVRYSASGRIVNGETGQPVAGANYGVYILRKDYEGSHSGGLTTNNQGEFKLHNLIPGTYAINVEPPPNSDWRVDPVPFKIVDQDVTGLVFKTSKGATVSGVIGLDEAEGKPLPKMARYQIHAHVSSPTGRGSNSLASINPDGSFRLSGLQAGMVSFWLVNSDRLQVVEVERQGVVSPRGIEIKELENVTGVRVLVNYANGSIHGTIKFATGALPPDKRFHLTLMRVSSDQYSRSVHNNPTIDARGQFIVEGLLPGTYEVKAFVVPLDAFPGPNTKLPQTSQQVIVTNGNVSNVTLTMPQN